MKNRDYVEIIMMFMMAVLGIALLSLIIWAWIFFAKVGVEKLFCWPC